MSAGDVPLREPQSGARPEPPIVESERSANRALAPLLVYLIILVAVVASLGAPLLPSVQADYGVSVAAAQWALTIALLTGAIATPIVGRLGVGAGRRTVLIVCLGAVAVGSLMCAIPLPFGLLLAGRGLQGVGLAVFPVTVSIAQEHLPEHRAGRMVWTLSVMTVASVGIGYPLTGVIADRAGYRAAFWVVLGLAVAAVLATVAAVPNGRPVRRQQFDALGAVVLSTGLAGLLLYISQGTEWGWATAVPLTILVFSVAALACWARREFSLTGRTPLVDLRVALQRRLLVANLTALLAMISMYMLLTLIVRFIQTPTSVSYGLGASITDSGFILLPLALGSFVAGVLADRVTRRVEPQRVIPLSLVVFVVASGLFAGFRTHLWEIVLIMAIAGVGNGFSFAVVPMVIAGVLPRNEVGSAIAFDQVLQRLGTAMGSALAATVLSAHPGSTGAFPSDRGYTAGCVIGIVLCGITGAVSWLVRSPRVSRQDESAVDQQFRARDVGGIVGG